MAFSLIHSVRLAQQFVIFFFAHLLVGVDADVPLHGDWESYQAGALGEQPMQSFYSAPHLKAPIFQVNKFEADKIDPAGYFFTSGNYNGLFQASMHSSKDLSLVWASEAAPGLVRAIQTYTYQGKPVIGFYAGAEFRIFNQEYRQIARAKPKLQKTKREKCNYDGHEGIMTHDETAIMIQACLIPTDLRSVGGPKKGETLRDCRFQEIDPVTGDVLFEFRGLDHFNMTDTIWPYTKEPGPYQLGGGYFDYCHMNSVEKTPEGDYLMSMRHFNAIALLDGKTHQMKWILGGRRNMFKDITVDGNATFAYQHQARVSGKNRITMLDNADLHNSFCPKSRKHCTRAIEIEVDPVAMTVKLIKEWNHPQRIISAGRGGVQRLPSGNTVVAWGQNAMYTEWAPDGELVMDIQRGPVVTIDHGNRYVLAYRIWKGDWVGKPTWGPNISAHGLLGPKQIYVSWNGATEVENWALLVSNSMYDLNGSEKVVHRLPRMGFETAFAAPEIMHHTYARVAALDKKGNLIGSTPAVHIKSGQLYDLEYEVTSVDAEKEEPASPASPVPKPAATHAAPVEKPSAPTSKPTDLQLSYGVSEIAAWVLFFFVLSIALALSVKLFCMLRKQKRRWPVKWFEEEESLLRE